MQLTFQQTSNRNQCAAEVTIDDLKTQCTFSTSDTVTIPQGLFYSGGKLEEIEDFPAVTFPICRNHASRLKNAFAEIIESK